MQGFGNVQNMVMISVLSEVELNQVLDQQTFTAPSLPDAGSTVSGIFITLNKSLPAVAAQCGDTLRLRVTLAGADGGALDELGPGMVLVP